MSGLVEILKGVITLILDLELESAELAETLHGGRFEGNDDGAGNSGQWTTQAINDGSGSVLPALALLIRLEGQEGESGVGRIASKAESGNSEGAEDIRNIPGYGRDLVADLTRVFQRSSGGSLYGDDEVALIFGGNKSLGHFPENEVSESKSSGKQD